MAHDESQIIPPQFQFLVNSFQFHIIGSEISSSFDNMYVELTNGSLNVRVSRERGFVDTEVSSVVAPNRWLPLSHIRQIVLRRDPVENVSLDEQAEFLRSHYSTIVEMLS